MSALWRRAEPLVALAGFYWVQFLLTRVSVDTVPGLGVTQPLKGFPAWLFLGWDGEHYFRLATSFDTYAWPPGYPMALRAMSLFGRVEVAAVLVNAAAHLAIFYLAYAYCRVNKTLNEVPGWLLASLILLFPGNNVFFAAYSESLFVALALAACVAWHSERLFLAGLLCGVASLTRNMGAFLGLAFLVAEAVTAARTRRFSAQRFGALGVWILFFGGWSLWLRFGGGTTALQETLGWQQELIAKHVPADANPTLWVLKYLALPGHKEFVFFWGAIAVSAWWIRRGMVVEGAFVLLFLASHLLYLYRPFPFTRYLSAAFPLAAAAAYACRRSPLAQVGVVSAALVLSHRYAVLLFSNRMGEP